MVSLVCLTACAGGLSESAIAQIRGDSEADENVHEKDSAPKKAVITYAGMPNRTTGAKKSSGTRGLKSKRRGQAR